MIVRRIVRFLWHVALWGFFRRIEVEGRELVPASGPVILAPNHANALVDPLIVHNALDRPVTLTIKATMKQNPLIRMWIFVCDVVLFHRRQDREAGVDRGSNRDALADCRKRLAAGGAICMFPEGVSHSDPQPRKFMNGVAKIALDWVADPPNAESLKIVPVGLHYEEKDRFRSAAAVRFGEPIDVAAWRAAHPEGGTAELTAELDRRVRELILTSERRRESFLLNWTAELLATGGAEPPVLGRGDAPLLEHVRLVRRLQDGSRRLEESHGPEVAAVGKRVREYHGTLRRLGITPAEVYLPMSTAQAAFFVLRELELMLVGLPLAAWGMLNHLVPYLLVRAVARRLSKDKDHWASNVVFPGLAAFPLFYLLQLGAAWIWLSWPWALTYSAALPYGGMFELLYRDRAGGALRRARTFLRLRANAALRASLQEEGRGILAEIGRLSAALGA